MIDIKIDDREVRAALDRLQRRLSDMSPVMRDIGELLAERAKQRFATSTAPDGSRWAPNAPSTLMAYLGKTGGSFRKDGRLSKKGAARAAAKKPLVGESGRLANETSYQAGRDHVVIFHPREYAAVQQFGAKKGQFGRTRRGAPIPWGDIPARPFFPVMDDARLYPDEIEAIRDKLIDLISKAEG